MSLTPADEVLEALEELGGAGSIQQIADRIASNTDGVADEARATDLLYKLRDAGEVVNGGDAEADASADYWALVKK